MALMIPEAQLGRAANAAAEEVLRVIYGDDLQGCTVSLDSISDVIRTVFEDHARLAVELAELHTKGFEAVQLLSTPPADGHALSPEDLRTLLGERLDKVREIATKILGATAAQKADVSDAEPGL